MQLIILDRDGVVNEDSDTFIKSPAEWVPVPGSLEAIARLNRFGYRVVVATNQSGIARGLFNLDTLNQIHQRMHNAVAEVGGQIDGVFFCPHGPDDNCECRKPAAGLFREIATRLRTNLASVPAIGDSLRDLQAAEAAGASPVLVRSGKGEETLAALGAGHGYPVYNNLAGFVDDLLAGL